MLAFDTETTGLDIFHGARPFFVTTCNEKRQLEFYEWDVDPFTRKVDAPINELTEVLERLSNQSLVAQNSKFDVAMLRMLCKDYGINLQWDWSKTHDTLIASHVLASNLKHSLDALAVRYLGRNINLYENDLENDVKKCRSYCQRRLPTWQIAKQDAPGMPSAGEKTWRFDYWLPRALATHFDHPRPASTCKHKWTGDDVNKVQGVICQHCKGHRWWVVLRDYANIDSAVTIALWVEMEKELRRRNLMEIYEVSLQRMRLAYDMEWRGLTASESRLEYLKQKYRTEAKQAGNACVEIAESYGYDLTLPKSGNNNSLKHFCFGRPNDGNSLNPVSGSGIAQKWLDLPVVGYTDGGEPSMDKKAMEEWQTTLERDSPQWEFIRNLTVKRKRDTAIAYMEGYQRFWLPFPQQPEYFTLHPNLNPTGTSTLRWSSNNPNEQNISKQGMVCLYCFGDGDGNDVVDGVEGKCGHCKGKGTDPRSVRYCFGPEPGYEWWSFDAKNIELRIPFYMAKEQALIDLFERPNDPPYYGSNHLLNFHTIYEDIWNGEIGKVCKECCKGATVDNTLIGPHCKKKFASTYYQWCKNMGFAKQYGAQKRKVDATARRPGAYELIEARFSKLAAYNAKQLAFAAKHGYVETLPDCTVNPSKGYPLLCTRTEQGKILPTVPLSYHVQGSAMWWTMKAMIRVDQKLQQWRKNGFDAYIALQIHDELVVAMPKKGDPSKWKRGTHSRENNILFCGTNLWRAQAIRKLMAKGGEDLNLPTPVGCEFHPVSWDEGVTLW